ncbi:hypothetical protein [Shewanella sp.]|uniref:hypothetical protein n=1 Tax=Shewanella sp. TaxID=50422 RepID=UPI003A96B606
MNHEPAYAIRFNRGNLKGRYLTRDAGYLRGKLLCKTLAVKPDTITSESVADVWLFTDRSLTSLQNEMVDLRRAGFNVESVEIGDIANAEASKRTLLNQLSAPIHQALRSIDDGDLAYAAIVLRNCLGKIAEAKAGEL